MKLFTKVNPWGIDHSVSNEVNTIDSSIVKYVEFNLTGRCDGQCISCPTNTAYNDEPFTKTGKDLIKELNLYQDMLIKLKLMGMEFLTIYGREPTLWDKEAKKETGEVNYFLKKLLDWIKDELKVRICLATSGLHLEESLIRKLFDSRGILFMKNWGGKEAYMKLMGAKNAYIKTKKAWEMVQRVRMDYKKSTVIAEFLYTSFNRLDLLPFYNEAYKNNILPQIEVPVILGDCVENFHKIRVEPETYVKDIYEVSLLNLSLKEQFSLKTAKDSPLWEPPFGSKFPMPCDRITKAKSLFLERNGNLRVCSGLPLSIGNINDKEIKEKLKDIKLLKKLRNSYNYLAGECKNCFYSKMNICYGCRGNGLSYNKESNNALGEDPMCFGLASLRLGIDKLKTFMNYKHIEKLNNYFQINDI